MLRSAWPPEWPVHKHNNIFGEVKTDHINYRVLNTNKMLCIAIIALKYITTEPYNPSAG
jgi:hypothetical protein